MLIDGDHSAAGVQGGHHGIVELPPGLSAVRCHARQLQPQRPRRHLSPHRGLRSSRPCGDLDYLPGSTTRDPEAYREMWADSASRFSFPSRAKGLLAGSPHAWMSSSASPIDDPPIGRLTPRHSPSEWSASAAS